MSSNPHLETVEYIAHLARAGRHLTAVLESESVPLEVRAEVAMAKVDLLHLAGPQPMGTQQPAPCALHEGLSAAKEALQKAQACSSTPARIALQIALITRQLVDLQELNLQERA